MTKAPRQSDLPVSPGKLSRTKIWILASSWIPVLVATAIAAYFLFAIHMNQVELASLKERLSAGKIELENVEHERDQALAEQKRILDVNRSLERQSEESGELIQTLAEKIAALQRQEDELRKAADVVNPAVVIKRVRDQLRNATPGQRADLLYREGKDAFDRLQVDAAEQLFTAAINEDPTFAPAFTGLGRAAASRHDLATAERYYRLSVTAQPRYTHGWYNLANINYMFRKYDKAREYVDKTLELDPGYEDAKKLRIDIDAALGTKK